MAIRETFKGWKIEIVGKPAVMLPSMEEQIAGRSRKVARLVVIGTGYSLWEGRKRNYSTWARKFDTDAKELLATLRKGARQFVWVTLREARAR